MELYDLKLNLLPVFLREGVYDFVLVLNDEEIARQQFHVQLVARTVG